MYEVFTVDIQSEPNFEELIYFDSLSVALAYSKVRVLFSSFATCSTIWEVVDGVPRKKVYRNFWFNREPITIEPGHELWYTDILLPFILAQRESSSGMQKRSRKRWVDLRASHREK